MDGLDFGWREAIWLLAALGMVYLVLVLLSLFRLRRPLRSLPPEIATPVIDVPEPPPAVVPEPWPAADVRPAAAPAADGQPSFVEQLARSGMEAEVRQLREEVANLREELETMKVSRRVSPMYADALELARRGFDARGIADECGISVAEAELVLALARDRAELDGEVEDDGSRQYVATDSLRG